LTVLIFSNANISYIIHVQKVKSVTGKKSCKTFIVDIED